MATTTSAIFSGSSRFSNDFQQVINRAVAIAQLPGNQLRSQKSTLQDESSALTSLHTTFSGVQSALDQLDTAVGGSQLSTSVSAGGILSAQVTNALEGTYGVNITDLGTSTLGLSKDTLANVANPATDGISTAASLTLTVGTTSRTLTPASHSLNDLAAAINANSDLGIRATIVRFGTESSPSYRLSIQATDVGDKSIALSDGTDLLDTITPGTPMKYQLSGVPTELTADSRTVTIAPGLSITAVNTGQANVTVSRSAATASSALSSLVNAYNGAVDALDAQHGEKAGPLSGESILGELGRSMSSLLSYTGTDPNVRTLADLGLTFDDKGKLSFDSSVFSAAFASHPDAVMSFLGRSSDGGFLKAAHDSLASAASSATGTLDALNQSITDQDKKINAEDDRVSLLRDQLTAQMSAADSLIASLEQQVTYITGLFAAQKSANDNR